MTEFCAAQIKAARALLDWSQEDLAKHTRLSITTIRTLELGHRPRQRTLQQLFGTIEDAGVEITEDGVRRRHEAIKVFRGERSCDDLFAQIGAVASAHHGDVLAYLGSEDFLFRRSGPTYTSNLHRLEALGDQLSLKCLVADTIALGSAQPFQYQSVPKWTLRPGVYFVYGDRHSTMWITARMEFCAVEFAVPVHALAMREDFASLWDIALSLKRHRLRKPRRGHD